MMEGKLCFSEAALENIACRTIEAFHPSLVFGEPVAIPIEDIIESHGIEIQYQYLRKNCIVLGEMVFKDGAMPVYDMEKQEYRVIAVSAETIFIDGRLAEQNDNGRLRFTMAHEFAHWLLHKRVYTGAHERASYIEESDTRLEWQANHLASALLMPKRPVKSAFFSLASICKNDGQTTSQLAQLFGVSKQAMRIRLETFKLI